MLVTWPLDRPYACLSLCSLCTSTRRHTSFSDSRVSLPLRCPPCSSMRCSARGSPLSLACLATFASVIVIAFVPSPPPSVSPVLRGPLWPTADSLEPVRRIPLGLLLLRPSSCCHEEFRPQVKTERKGWMDDVQCVHLFTGKCT